MNKQKLVVISMDAMISQDLEYAKQYPYFNKILTEGARVNAIKSVYPTLTYVCHSTMSSGCYPNKTGIINNEEMVPGKKNLPWLWFRESVKCQDIFDACKKKGLFTASVGWPVTGNHPNVDYLIDEIWPYKKEDVVENYKEAYINSGTGNELYEIAVAPYIDMRVGRNQPQSSFFLVEAACTIIRKYQPDIMLVHVGNIDKYRHLYGVHAKETLKGIEESEITLEKLFTAIKDAGIEEQTNIVVTSDHGQIDIIRQVNPNVLLAEQDLINIDENGRLVDWKCWVSAAGTSAQVFLKNPDDATLYEKVYNFFAQLSKTEGSGIGKIFTKEQVQQNDRLDGEFSFVLETDGKTGFTNSYTGDYLITLDKPKGSHGFHPNIGPCPVFIGYGPAFKKGTILEHANLVDGAPTYAHILGVSLPDADGRVLYELLEDSK